MNDYDLSTQGGLANEIARMPDRLDGEWRDRPVRFYTRAGVEYVVEGVYVMDGVLCLDLAPTEGVTQ